MDKENIIISNPEKIEAAKQQMISDGVEKLLVVSDFDKTLTSCFVGGKKIASLISILRDEKLLTADYPENAQALYDRYHPLEINPDISFETKKAAMSEWWSRHYELLIKSGLSRKEIETVTESKKLSLRKGATDFIALLKNANIPLLILSSAGMGSETIELYLKRFGEFDNIRIASNSFIWDDDGKAIGVNEPIIHTFNKDFAAVKQFSFYNELESRKNVILLGDGLGDAEMLNGFDHEEVIKIGFLNDSTEGRLEDFKKAFDIVILNDGPMDFANILIKELIAG